MCGGGVCYGRERLKVRKVDVGQKGQTVVGVRSCGNTGKTTERGRRGGRGRERGSLVGHVNRTSQQCTVQTTDKKVTPKSKLFQELDINMSGMDDDVELSFSSLVDEGTKTDTMGTVPGSICGTLSAPITETEIH